LDAIQQAAAKGEWAEVLRGAPQLVASQPGNVAALLALAEACAAQGFSECELCYVRAALEAAGDEVATIRRVAESFARLRKYDEALACWRKVETLDSEAEEAPQRIATLTIALSRQRAGFSIPGEAPPRAEAARGRRKVTRRPVVGKLSGVATAVAEGTGPALSQIQQLEAAIRERPSYADLYLRLAQLYLDKDREYDADRLLAKGRDATDHESRVQQMWEEVAVARNGRRVKLAEDETNSADTAVAEKAREALAQATKERDRTELEIFRGRVKRQPECATNHFELGLCLKRMEKYQEALEHLQRALAGAEERCRAALELARCYSDTGDVPQAMHFYRVAADAALPEQSSEKKEALRRAGSLAMRMKMPKLVERYAGKPEKVSVGKIEEPKRKRTE
jgi:tetratricopeptide (TPR) repeat protein